MTEYIDREAISEEIRKYYYKNPLNSSYGEGLDRGLDRAQRAILEAPAADVEPVVSCRDGKIIDVHIRDTDDVVKVFVPVRHGRWIDKGEYAVCMECGGRSGTQYDGVEQIPLMTQFCPNCGAKMDLEVTNDA